MQDIEERKWNTLAIDLANVVPQRIVGMSKDIYKVLVNLRHHMSMTRMHARLPNERANAKDYSAFQTSFTDHENSRLAAG